MLARSLSAIIRSSICKYSLLIFVFIFAFEVFLRVCGFGTPLLYNKSPYGYVVKPNQSIYRFFNHINYDAQGYRLTGEDGYGPETVLCIGDSITFGGVQVNDSETYPSKLEKIIYENGNLVDVKNFSAAGWSIQNQFAWLKDQNLSEFKYVIIQVGQNDLFQKFVGQDIIDNHKSFRSKNPPFATYEFFDSYVISKILKIKSHDPGGGSQDFDQVEFENNVKSIMKIIDLAKSKKVNIYFLYIDPLQKTNDARVVNARNSFFNIIKENNIPIIRPLTYIMSDRDLLYRDNVHPNESGNSVIAEAVYFELQREIIN